MRRISICILLIGFAGCGAANSAPTEIVSHANFSGATPRAVVTPAEADAGDQLIGTPVEFQFRVSNSGGAPLEIAVKPRCGCTVTRFDPVIAPRATGLIQATLRTRGFSGLVHKSVDVTTNDPQRPKVNLTLSATIVNPIQIDRQRGKILRLNHSETGGEEFDVRVHPTESAQLTGISCDQPWAQAVLEPVSAEQPAESGGTESNASRPRAYHVRLTVTPDAPVGRSRLTVRLSTDSESEPTVEVPIICEKGIVVIPAEIQLTIHPDTKLPYSRSVLMRHYGDDFRILKVECDDPFLDVAEAPTQVPLQRFAIQYSGGAAPGQYRATVRFHTDDPDEPVVEVSVVYEVTDAIREQAPATASRSDQAQP